MILNKSFCRGFYELIQPRAIGDLPWAGVKKSLGS